MSRDKDTSAGGMGSQVQHTDDAPPPEPVQVAPPFPVSLPDSSRPRYPLLPSRTARAEIVHARERSQERQVTAKGDDQTGGRPSASDGEITPATAQRYLDRCIILVTRYRRECDIREDVPSDGEGVFSTLDAHAFGVWLLSLKPDLSAATWRYYRRVAYHVISSLPHDSVEAALALLDNDRARHESRAGTDGRGKRGRTSPRRATGFDRDDFSLIQQTLLYQPVRSDTPQILRDWMTAGISVGLRPLEWRATAVEVGTDPATGTQMIRLFVMNPKTTNMSSNGVVRTIDISTLSDDAISAVHRMSERGRRWNMRGAFDDEHAKVARYLTSLSQTLFPRRTVHYSLYSCRHQFIANMNTIFSPAQVLALTGGDIAPQQPAPSAHGAAWPPDAIAPHPHPIIAEVDILQAIIDINTERRQFTRRRR